MFAACTYEEIEKTERLIENKEIVVLLFARATETEILKEFEYIHYNSGKYCSVYAVGYTDDSTKQDDPFFRKVNANVNNTWYFSTKAFVDFKEKLQNRIKWTYSGETEVLILQNNPGQRNVLNFQNYVAIDVNKGIREGYIDSFQNFIESLIRSAHKRVNAKTVVVDIERDRISIKEMVSSAINESKRISAPIKLILRDRLFYKPSRSIV